jgi:DNA-binding NtrC family response regulator
MLPKSILIVDDDRNLRHSLALILQREGYVVETAENASECMAYLRSGKFDLTILELMMPDESASILLPKLMRLYPRLAFIILTSQAGAETEAEAAHLGEHSRLTKPVTPEALLKQVRSSLHIPNGGSHPLREIKLHA